MVDVFISYATSLDVQPMIGAGLPASFELHPIDLLERQLAVENAKRESLSSVLLLVVSSVHRPPLPLLSLPISANWTRSWVTWPAATHDVLRLPVGELWGSLARRAVEALEELSDQLPELDSAAHPPRPDPQPVDVSWLDQLPLVTVRESSDLQSWYASTGEE